MVEDKINYPSATTSFHPPPSHLFYSHLGRYLEVTAVALPEGQDEAFEDQLSNLRELGVDDGNDSGINMSEDRRCSLSLKH